MTELAHRRWVGRVIRFGLVAFAVVLVGAWLWGKARRSPPVGIETQAPVAEALAPGDARIYSRDSSVNLVLQGDRILAGLSPQLIAKIRSEIAASGPQDSGLGGQIAAMVKKEVADKISTHVEYPLRDIRDIRYEDEEIVIEDMKGNRARLFSSVKVNREALSKSFAPADAQRFVELAKARKASLR